jgi:hypothetical protein
MPGAPVLENELHWVADREDCWEMVEMHFSLTAHPAAVLNQAGHEHFALVVQTGPTLVVTDQADRAHSTNSHCVGDLELDPLKIRASRTQDVGEIIGYPKYDAVVHAHSDEQFGPVVPSVREIQVVVGEHVGDGRGPERRQNVVPAVDRKKRAHD